VPCWPFPCLFYPATYCNRSMDRSTRFGWESIWGEASLAAVGNANVIMFLLFGRDVGFRWASTIMVAQCVGAKNNAEAKRVVGTSAVFFLGLSLTMSLMGLHWRICWWLGCARHRMRCRWRSPICASFFLALPFMGGLFFLMAVLRGAGDSRTPFNYLFMSVGARYCAESFVDLRLGSGPAFGDSRVGDRDVDRAGAELFPRWCCIYIEPTTSLCIPPQ